MCDGGKTSAFLNCGVVFVFVNAFLPESFQVHGESWVQFPILIV